MRILVIEDDPTVGEFVRRGLEEQRWQADLVANGLEGERLEPLVAERVKKYEGLTLEQNLIDLGWHQKEFQRRRSFAYTVVHPSESQVLGCVYINPTRKLGHRVAVPETRLSRQAHRLGGVERSSRREAVIIQMRSDYHRPDRLEGPLFSTF
jgi:hypothetical protein